MKILTVVAAGLAMLIVGAAPAAAKSRDRNHDRISDRWERQFHLSLKVNQARRDPDRDGLRNLGEFRSGHDPRDADSDDDGIKDGDENAGTIVSFEGGVLKIDVAGPDDLSGKVTETTEIKCESEDDHEQENDANESDHTGSDHQASSSHDQGDDPGDDDAGPGAGGGSSDNEHDGPGHGDGQSGDGEHSCTSADLVPGTNVHESELKLGPDGAVFTEIQLVK